MLFKIMKQLMKGICITFPSEIKNVIKHNPKINVTISLIHKKKKIYLVKNWLSDFNLCF